MTNFSGKPLSLKTENAGTSGPKGGGMYSRHTDQVAEVSAQYLAEAAKNAVPVGYKQTEVGVIPEGWKVFGYGELFELTVPKKPIKPKSLVSFVGMQDVTEQAQLSAQHLIDIENVKSGFTYFERGDVLVAKITPCFENGKGCHTETLQTDVGFGSTEFHVLRANDNADSRFIYYWSTRNVLRKSLESEMVGSAGHRRVPMAAIASYKIPAPSKQEQAAIANALSDVDALISELEKLIAKKQAIKTATMQQLLTGRTRLPQFALREDGTPKGTNPSELGEIPEDWDAIKMGDLAKIQRGASPRPIDSPIWFERNSTVGWLRISDVTKTSKYLTETTQSLSELGIANSRFVPENNLVMSICATVGKPIITKKDLCIHDGFVVFNGLSVNQDFMYYILKELEDVWSKKGQTGSQMNLNTDLINGTFVAVPKDAAEQTAIATILSDMDAEIQALAQRLGKTRQIKQGMMQELLTGKTRLVQPSLTDVCHAD